MFKAVRKNQYIDITYEGILIVRIYVRKNPMFGLSDQDRADEIVKLFNENPERVLRGFNLVKH